MDDTKKEEKINFKSLMTSQLFWKIYIPTILILCGGAWKLYDIGKDNGQTKHEKIKLDLEKSNERLNSGTAVLNKRINKLKKDSIACVETINKLIKIDSINEHQVIVKTKKLTERTESTQIQKKPQVETNIEDTSTKLYADEIKKLKTENKRLKTDLELIQSEKADLKREIQRFINEQDMLIVELEILQDKMEIAKEEEKQAVEKEFNELLKKAKEKRIEFDNTQEGEEFQREIEAYKKQQADMQIQLEEQKRQIQNLTNGLTNLKSENADDHYENAISTLKSAESMFNWFGINNKEKCNLIKQVYYSFDNATRLGKDCSKERSELKNKYPKCLNP